MHHRLRYVYRGFGHSISLLIEYYAAVNEMSVPPPPSFSHQTLLRRLGEKLLAQDSTLIH
jgi:hypothetical protein